MREDSKLKVLGFIFGTNLKKTTADNYERIIKPSQESVGFKHLYLSKTVVYQPNHASRKPPLGKDKKGHWNFFMVWIPVKN
jgi:hypothetical protein